MNDLFISKYVLNLICSIYVVYIKSKMNIPVDICCCFFSDLLFCFGVEYTTHIQVIRN